MDDSDSSERAVGGESTWSSKSGSEYKAGEKLGEQLMSYLVLSDFHARQSKLFFR